MLLLTQNFMPTIDARAHISLPTSKLKSLRWVDGIITTTTTTTTDDINDVYDSYSGHSTLLVMKVLPKYV
jgi:hypothetical protein